jgi:hypothetical protein
MSQCLQCGGTDFVTRFSEAQERRKSECVTCKRARGREYTKALWARLHREVLTHYSSGALACALCGESHFEFLALDHMNGDGASHRREVGVGPYQLRVLQKQGYPSGFRVLCHNCNHLVRPSKGYKLAFQEAWFRRLREDVLRHYSGEHPACGCCGIDDLRVLTIDHINGGGREHRRVTGKGMAFYRWLQKNGYPTGFRVLCHNCNHVRGHVRGFVGPCPHELQMAI